MTQQISPLEEKKIFIDFEMHLNNLDLEKI